MDCAARSADTLFVTPPPKRIALANPVSSREPAIRVVENSSRSIACRHFQGAALGTEQ